MGINKKNKESKKSHIVNDIPLLIGFLFLISLHILGSFWHSYYSWGFSYWSVLPINYSIGLGIFSFVSILAVYAFNHKLNFKFIDNYLPTKTSYKLLLSIIASLFVVGLLYYFRSRAYVYGDGYSVLDFCSTNSPLETIDQHFLQLLAVYFHQFMYKTLSPFPFFANDITFASTNVIGGLIGSWAIYKISGLLARNTKEHLFFFIISFSSASIILFFGYVENYTWSMVFMLWALYFAISYVNNSTSMYPLGMCTIIAFAFHMITLPMLATVLFILLHKFDATKKFMKNLKRLHLVLFLLIGSLLILFVAQLNGISVFIPLWELPKNNYSLLTLNHFSDILNLLLLLSPLGLLFLLVSIKSDQNDLTEKVLFILTFLTFLSACFIDPQLGMLRDWDLLSLFGIPLTLWGGYRFSRAYSENQFPSWVIVASFIIVLVHILPNIYEKNNPQLAVEYLDTVLWEDPHYQAEYQDALRGISWGAILQKNTQHFKLSEKYYFRNSSVVKRNTTPLYNLSVLHNDNNQLDSARIYLQKGLELNPFELRLLSLLAEVEYKSKNYRLAEKYAGESIRIDSNYINGLAVLAVISLSQGNKEDALLYYRKAYYLEPDNYSCIKNIGYYFLKSSTPDSALFYLNKALPIASTKQKPKILGSLISLSLHLNDRAKAIEYLNLLKSLDPNSQIIKIKELEINGK